MNRRHRWFAMSLLQPIREVSSDSRQCLEEAWDGREMNSEFCGFLYLRIDNPKVAGSNPAPATKQSSDFKEFRKGRPRTAFSVFAQVSAFCPCFAMKS